MLTVTRIFPNAVEPLSCAFARQQLAALRRRCEVEVLATIPYLAGSSLFGDRTRPGRLSRVPLREEIDGISVIHPRVPYLPGAGTLHALAPVNAPLYLAGLLPHLRELRNRFDVVLGTFLFPDACAAAALARMLGLPYVIKTHGTDVNVVGEWSSVQPIIAPVLRGAACSIGVSAPMVESLIRLGAARERAVLLVNGVDRSVFHPVDKAEARRSLGLPDDGQIVLYVGRLDPEKGLRELCEAFERVQRSPERKGPVHFVVLGGGPFRAELDAAAERLNGVGPGRFIVAGEKPLREVALHLGAADLLTLPSYNEGTPNVVLEALATGRPVVGTNVGGIPDVVTHGKTGFIVPPRDAGALAEALLSALDRTWDPGALADAAPPSWDDNAAELHALLEAAARPRVEHRLAA